MDLPSVASKILSSQFAYIPGEGKSTVSALTLMYHDIVKFLDSAGCVRVLSIDFAKAFFHRILHSRFLEKLVEFELPREAISWVSNFLADRFQRVKVGQMTSSWQPVLSGVPQGSV